MDPRNNQKKMARKAALPLGAMAGGVGVLFALASGACSSSGPGLTMVSGTGGDTSSGGALQSGGATQSGGAPSATGGVTGSGGVSTAGAAGAGALDPVCWENPLAGLLGPPLVFSPTSSTFGLSAVVGGCDPADLSLRVRAEEDDGPWIEVASAEFPAHDIAEWKVSGLDSGSVYEYELLADDRSVFVGRAVTQREPGESYEFALITDSHIEPRDVGPGDLSALTYAESVLLQVDANVAEQDPDFLFNLGDMLDFHDYGFNDPPPSGEPTRLAYLNYRRLLDQSLGRMAHFPVIGNWDGENGNYTDEQIAYSQAERLLYLPAPEPDTYPQGGNDAEDYYAFTWGDALYVVLNVMTYTPTAHLLSTYPGVADDWTLGQEQLSWLETTLSEATSKWRFLLIHHTVGGAAADEINAAYGRGGGLAAMVGEQALVHQMMLDHGVQIFFYGHDHVFTDIIVDDIHYALPGSAGAPWKFEGDETGYSTYWTDSGHGLVSVSPESVDVDFVNVEGEVLHSFSVTE